MTYRCRCRATNKEQGTPRYSQNWVRSIKGKLEIDDNKISCGPLDIKLSNIVSAHLYNVKTFLNIPYCKVLELKTENEYIQFSLNPWTKINRYLPISFSESNCKMVGIPYSSYPKGQKLFMLLVAIFLIWFALKNIT